MKKSFKMTTLVVTLLLAVSLFSTVAFAAVNGESFKRVTVSTTWTTIASDTEGFNCNVEITGQLTTVGPRIDVRMLGKDGNVLWSESNSCPGLGSRVYACGADVYELQVRVSSSDVHGTAIALKTSKPAD